MTIRLGSIRWIVPLVLLLAACGGPDGEATPTPTTFPVAPAEEAVALAAAYLDAWAAGDYAAMHGTLDPVVQERYPLEAFTEAHEALRTMARIETLGGSTGEPRVIGLPAEPRPAEFPDPTPTPVPSAGPSSSVAPPEVPAPSIDPAEPRPGPVPGLAVPMSLTADSARFGSLDLERELTMVQGRDGWLVRWSPATVVPELGPAGALRLDRSLGPRGRILGVDDTVWAETREDGIRAYPQESLAGQVVGYVGEVTAEDLERLGEGDYRPGDVIGRSGLEAGAEALLRGTPGWALVATRPDQPDQVLHEVAMVPGADIRITIRPAVQATAEAALAPYGSGATVAIDPGSGDVWALASQPAFNPNAMTLGTTLGGVALAPAGPAQIFNKAVLAAYPAGSSFKPFTLAAALKTGVVTPSSLVTCPSTWPYGNFTFRNYEDHSLPGQVTLAQAMAFSCNTTYMPLSLSVYEREETALTDLLFEFGFGAATGITYLVEETGIVPDDAWLAANGRGGYSGFEQIQLSIGQGAFLGTPLQLANAYSAIGNGGTLWTPRVVTGATLPDGTSVLEVEPTPIRQVSVSASDLAYVTDTLVAVTTLSYGTGTAAFGGFGVPVAGKSGTAETGTPDPHAWFPAFAPAGAPTVTVATVLPNIPLGTGGSDAAPLVRRVMAAHFAN